MQEKGKTEKERERNIRQNLVKTGEEEERQPSQEKGVLEMGKRHPLQHPQCFDQG